MAIPQLSNGFVLVSERLPGFWRLGKAITHNSPSDICPFPISGSITSFCPPLLEICDAGMAGTATRVDKYPRTTYEYGNHMNICVYSYSTVDVIKQRNMVNSEWGVRRGWTSIEVYSTFRNSILTYHKQVPNYR